MSGHYGARGADFARRYKRAYGEGERTNMCVEAAYFQVKLFAKALEQVKTDVGLGRLLGVRQTPTYFLNGVKLEGALPPPLFETAIRHECAPRTLVVKLKTSDFRTLTRSLTPPKPPAAAEDLLPLLPAVLERFDPALRYRLAGVGLGNLVEPDAQQPALAL
mgnify:CR=1 FL=1